MPIKESKHYNSDFAGNVKLDLFMAPPFIPFIHIIKPILQTLLSDYPILFYGQY
ncbi:hypothetical protein RhiirA1_410303 [Rhizophagus irregularis]|nr:hypothetical protein RhiirA1_410303 [Rhizophagus irregularis]GET63846.1 hypothetical protein RIR_e36226_A0A2N0SDH9_9GLOM [Rhizophagus irregularis DAOM 181602=DAOM 197198]